MPQTHLFLSKSSVKQRLFQNNFANTFNSFCNYVIRILALLWSIFPARALLFPCFLSLCNCVYLSSRPNICNCVQAFYLPCNFVQAWSIALQFSAHQSCQMFQVPWLNCKPTATSCNCCDNFVTETKISKAQLTWIRSSNHIHWDRHPRVSFDALCSWQFAVCNFSCKISRTVAKSVGSLSTECDGDELEKTERLKGSERAETPL